jgi:phosphoribosylanthranilate isomerase
MTAIKICGVARLEDAQAAAALGVDAVGFVLWPGSPRTLPMAEVGAIVAALPPFVTPVGVFVEPSSDDLRAAAEVAGIRLAQVHGRAPNVADLGIRILQSVRLGEKKGSFDPAMPAGEPVHIDTNDPIIRGGTGRTVDWQSAALVAMMRPVVLAGGLTPGNVAEAVHVVAPYGVDVSSGVESAPGQKDPELMRAFVEAVRRVR